MKTNYVKLMETLVQVRHAVTHDNGRFSVKPKADIDFLKKYMTVAEDREGFVLLPSDEQVNHLLDLVQEYAFLLAKQLCIELKLPWAHTTYSMQNEMEKWHSRFDLRSWG